MNKNRRETIATIRAELENQCELLSQVADEEQEYYDNMPESIQDGSKGGAAMQTADNLASAASELETMIDALDNAEE